jgi:hypothetical protein
MNKMAKIQDKEILSRLRLLPEEKKKEVLDFISFLILKAKEKDVSYETRFNLMLSESRSWFNNWLKAQGYDPKTLTDDEIERIIQNA